MAGSAGEGIISRGCVVVLLVALYHIEGVLLVILISYRGCVCLAS